MLSIVKTLSILTLAAGLAVLSMPNNVQAQVWSEPIQLTNLDDRSISDYYAVAVDNGGNIHLLFQTQNPNDRVLYLFAFRIDWTH